MQLRFPRVWRVSSAVLLGVASWGGLTSPAQAETLHPRLTHQDATVTVGTNGNGHMRVALQASGSSAAATVRITLYPALRTRSAVESVISGQGPGTAPLDSTGTFVLNCLSGQSATFDVALGSWRDTYTPCGSVRPTLQTSCGSRCHGVFPLQYSVTTGGNQVSMWSLVTITSGTIAQPLRIAWTLASQATKQSEWSSAREALALLASNARPITLALSADELHHALTSVNPEARRYVTALQSFLVSPQHRVMAMGPRAMDYGSLRAHGLGVDVPQHFTIVEALLAEVTSESRMTDAVFLPGVVGSASATAVDHQGRHVMVVGEEALRTAPSRTLSWGAPFHLAGAPASARALAIDSPLSALATRHDIEPSRLAALTMGTLSMLYYQAPNARSPRTEVLTTSLDQVSPTFTKELGAAMTESPLLTLRSIDAAATVTQIGKNRSPALRSLTSAPTAPWRSAEITTLANLNRNTASLVSTFSSPAPFLKIQLARLQAEVGRSSHAAGVVNAQRVLTDELAKFRIDQSTVILASASSTIPVTLYSSADYGITGLLSVKADRIEFPQGQTFAVGILTQTASIPISATMTSGASSLMTIRLTTTDGRVVIATGTIQVRYSAASVVGYALSAGSLLVIGWWWWRTSRRKRPVRSSS